MIVLNKKGMKNICHYRMFLPSVDMKNLQRKCKKESGLYKRSAE